MWWYRGPVDTIVPATVDAPRPAPTYGPTVTDRMPGESPAPSLWEGANGSWWLRDPCGLMLLDSDGARRWQEKRKAAA